MCLGKKKTKSPSRISHISAGCCTSLLPPEACSSLCYARGVADAARAAAPCPPSEPAVPTPWGSRVPSTRLPQTSYSSSPGRTAQDSPHYSILTLVVFSQKSITLLFFFFPLLFWDNLQCKFTAYIELSLKTVRAWRIQKDLTQSSVFTTAAYFNCTLGNSGNIYSRYF